VEARFDNYEDTNAKQLSPPASRRWTRGLATTFGLLPDHIHLILRCPIELSPQDIALSFLNNCAYAVGMKAEFRWLLIVMDVTCLSFQTEQIVFLSGRICVRLAKSDPEAAWCW